MCYLKTSSVFEVVAHKLRTEMMVVCRRLTNKNIKKTFADKINPCFILKTDAPLL